MKAQNSRCSGQDLKQAPTEYKSEELLLYGNFRFCLCVWNVNSMNILIQQKVKSLLRRKLIILIREVF